MEKTKKNFSIKRIISALISIICIIIIIVGSYLLYVNFTAKEEYYIGEKNLEIPILVYHDIVKNESEVEFDYMQTTYDKYKKQIGLLMELGYKPISYQDLKDYSEGKKKLSKWSFLITFDDGYKGVYEYAYKYSKKKKIPITAFIINNRVKDDDTFSWEEAKEMYDSGLVGIYSHTYYHDNVEYDKMSGEEIVEEINKSYAEIEEKLEAKDLLKVFTYPRGSFSNESIEALKNAGYMQNLTDNKVNLSNSLDIYSLHREYPLNNSFLMILLKTKYRILRYGNK